MHNIVYALESPLNGKVYYVGQSKQGLKRSYSHHNSHNGAVREWVRSLGDTEPVVRILERELDDHQLLDREAYWIHEMLMRKEPIFNIAIPTPKQLRYRDYDIGAFLKERRKELGLTQVEFSHKAGIGLQSIRKIEQGNTSLNLNTISQALYMFGATLIPVVQ